VLSEVGFAKSAQKSDSFAFFGSNRADNPNIFCNFAPVLQRKVKIP
jgi:hypothetical protein